MISNKRKRQLIKFGKACAITVLAFLLSWITVYNFTSYFAPLEKTSDFLESDFYTMVANSQTVKEYDDKIAVVNVDGLSRSGISETFRALAKGKPVVVAVDIMFEERGDSTDIEIAESLSLLPVIVFPATINFDEESIALTPSVYDYIDNGTPGIVNLDINSQRNIVRTFKPIYTQDGIERESMAYVAVKKFLGTEPERISPPGESIDINFTSMEFDSFSAAEVIENPELVTGKLIFVGELENLADVHSTPLDEYVPGVMIHAYSASTILNGKYIIHASTWVVWLISLLLSILFIYAQLSLSNSKAGNILMRWLQTGILLMLIFIGSILYLEKRISLNLSLPLMMIALGLLACDLWQMLETIPEWSIWISNKWFDLKKFMSKKRIGNLIKLCIARKKKS